jgi:hypothetical protein
MEISKKSWHYKLGNIFFDADAYGMSLCKYFWLVIGACAIIAIICFASCLLFLLLMMPVWINFNFIYNIFIPNFQFHFAVSIICFSVWVIVLLSIKWIIQTDYPEHKLNRVILKIPKIKTSNIKIKKPNIFIEYLKAKKRKICPILEFKND